MRKFTREEGSLMGEYFDGKLLGYLYSTLLLDPNPSQARIGWLAIMVTNGQLIVTSKFDSRLVNDKTIVASTQPYTNDSLLVVSTRMTVSPTRSCNTQAQETT